MSEPLVLRSRPLITFIWICAIGSLVLFGVTAASGPGADAGPIDYIGTAIFGVLMSLGFLRGTRSRVELNNDGITIVNYLLTHHIAWRELRAVSADYGGLRLVKADGTVVTAGSLGKSNWATWLKRRTAADDRVELIQKELHRHTEDGT